MGKKEPDWFIDSFPLIMAGVFLAILFAGGLGACMSFQPKPVKGNTFRLWWQAHWTDFLLACALAAFVSGLAFAISYVDLLLYRSGNLVVQAVVLALLVDMFAGVIAIVVKD